MFQKTQIAFLSILQQTGTINSNSHPLHGTDLGVLLEPSPAYCLYILQWMSVWMVHGFPSLLFIHTSVDVCVDGTWVPQPIVYNTSVDVSVDGTWVPQPIVYTYFSGCLCGWYMGSPAYCLYILQWMSVWMEHGFPSLLFIILQWMSLWMVHGFPSLLFIHTSVDVCVDGTWVP